MLLNNGRTKEKARGRGTVFGGFFKIFPAPPLGSAASRSEGSGVGGQKAEVGRQKAKAPQRLAEIERQKAVLVELPHKYELPIFNGHFVTTHTSLASASTALPMTSFAAVRTNNGDKPIYAII